MKTRLLIFSLAAFIFTSCSKNNSDNTTTTDTYINTNAGSTWNYHQVDSSGSTPSSSDYTLSSSSQDTTINSKKYHIYNYSYGGSEYMALAGNNYYQYDSIPVTGGANIERLYLKDNVKAGTTWSQPFNLTIPNVPIPVTLTVTNNIVEKGISRTVNGISYSNVIHVSTSLSSDFIQSTNFTSNIDSYYAPKYGLIESRTVVHLDYLSFTENVNMNTQLMSADLK